MGASENRYLEILEMMIEDAKRVDPLYQPTNFWRLGTPLILEDIRNQGIASFRSHPSAHSYYVPLYARPFYRTYKQLIDSLCKALDELPYRNPGTEISNLLSGYTNAYADYRVFIAADTQEPPFLSTLSESDVGSPVEQYVFNECAYSCSFLSYLRGLAFLKRHVNTANLVRVIEIGGGYGTLGEILLKARPDAFYLDVDLPPVAAVATYYLSEVFGPDNVLGYDKTKNMEVIDIEALTKDYRAAVLCSWQLPRIRGRVDLFANFISFQEMEPSVVRNYIAFIQGMAPDFVLLRNLREGKAKATAPGVSGVIEPTRLDQMISWFDGFRLVARDTMVFGELKIDGYHSEVVCMVNPHNSR